MPSSIVVNASQLMFRYPNSKQPTIAIKSFLVEAGERIFLHGPSGSGKTTFLSLLAGVLQPTSGSLKILDREMKDLSASARDRFRGEHMGYIFQMFNLIPYLSARENIQLPNQMFGRSLQDNGQPKTEKLARRLNLEAILDKPVTELSVGQQQRVAVARALMGEPKLILADEPTSALDTDNREQFLNLLNEFCKELGAALVFVSHDRGIAHLFDKTVSLAEMNEVKAS